MRISTASDLGALVRQARQDQGLTQSDLAEKVGATRQWVAQLESGAPNTRLELVLEALRALDLRVDVGPERGRARPPLATERSVAGILDAAIARASSAGTITVPTLVKDWPVPGTTHAALAALTTERTHSERANRAGSPLGGILADQARRLAQIERSKVEATESDSGDEGSGDDAEDR